MRERKRRERTDALPFPAFFSCCSSTYLCPLSLILSQVELWAGAGLNCPTMFCGMGGRKETEKILR